MHFKISSAICFNLDQSKILSSGNGLTETDNSGKQDQRAVHEMRRPILLFTLNPLPIGKILD